MKASIEWPKPFGLIRVHDDDGVYGDKWDFCCVIQRTSECEGIISLAPRAPTTEEYRAIRVELKAEGFKSITWERKNVPHARIVKKIIKDSPDVIIKKLVKAKDSDDCFLIAD